MRSTLRLAALLAVVTPLVYGCVDAPINTSDLQPNGELRTTVYDQAGFSASQRAPRQAVPHVSAVLAAQAHGALEDAPRFPAGVREVHLHLRADDLPRPRPVVLRWTYGDRTSEVLSVLSPSDTMALATSHPIADDEVGSWKVEVLGLPVDGAPPQVLVAREFEISAASG